MPCGIDIVNGLDRIYNLLDVRLAGIERTSTGTGTEADPFVYDPPIFQTPEIFDDEPISMIGLATNNNRAWKNLLNGTTSSDFGDDRSFRDQLQSLVDEDAGDDADISTIITALTAAGVDLDALLLLLA